MSATSPRVGRIFDGALLVAAAVVVVLSFVSWAGPGPGPDVGPYIVFVLISLVVVLGVMLTSESPTVATAVSPVVSGIALGVVASPLIQDDGQAMLPLWALAVAVSYLVVFRGRIVEMFPLAAITVLAGQFALGLDLPVTPESLAWSVVSGLLKFLVCYALLIVVRTGLVGRARIETDLTARVTFAALAALGYGFAVVGGLQLLHRNPGDPWIPAGIVMVGLLVVLLLRAVSEATALRRRADALTLAARETPWPEDEIESTMVRLISEHVRVDSVALEAEPGGRGAVSAQVQPDRWVVARRQRHDTGFSRHDAELVAGIGALGRESYIRAATEHRLHEESVTDELTGLWKYKYWRTLIADSSRNRPAAEVIGIVFFDLDYFKQINETYGHLRADIALATTGRRLLAFSSQWRFARFGGDEFVGICHGVRSEQEFDEECARLRQQLGEPVSAEGRDIVLGVTIGRTLSSDPEEPVTRIVARAERDVRRRKSDRPGPEAAPTDTELVQGLLGGGLEVAFQPIVALPTRAVHGWEALLRGTIPGRGPVSPPELVAAARQVGALDAITQRVAEEAIAIAESACQHLGRRVAMSINLESDQVTWESEALAWIGQRARTTSAELVLEISERGDDDWGEEQYEVIDELERHGLGLALDDFGAGQSRLRALTRRRWRWVKLDRDFLTTQGPGLTLLRHNVRAMHELGQAVVLEGLEDEAQVELAESLGIDFAQGYWFGRPLSADDLLAGLAPELR